MRSDVGFSLSGFSFSDLFNLEEINCPGVPVAWLFLCLFSQMDIGVGLIFWTGGCPCSLLLVERLTLAGFPNHADSNTYCWEVVILELLVKLDHLPALAAGVRCLSALV